MKSAKQTIFISCGQYTETERELGLQIERLVRELTPCEPYLAQDQSTLENLTQTVFRALDECVGFIGVMHHRGEVTTPDRKIIRGSVWIEQEIAIAAFLRQVLRRDLRVRMYTQRGIVLEGIRDKLQINPIEFDSNDQVLEHLKSNLADWSRGIGDQRHPSLHFEIRHRPENSTGDYRFQVWLTNDGPTPVDDYYVNVKFPKEFIRSVSHGLFDPEYSDPHAIMYRLVPKTPGFRTMFPDSNLAVVDFAYYVGPNDQTCQNALNKKVVVSLYAGNALIQREEKPVSELV